MIGTTEMISTLNLDLTTSTGNESLFYNTFLVLIDAYECDTSSETCVLTTRRLTCESRSLGVEDGTYLILLGVVELSFWNYGCHHVAISVIYTSYKYQILGYFKYTRLSILPIEIWTFFIVIQYAIQIYPWKN